MSTVLDWVPADERPALENWIANTDLEYVAACLSFYALTCLADPAPPEPHALLYGLAPAELLERANAMRATGPAAA